MARIAIRSIGTDFLLRVRQIVARAGHEIVYETIQNPTDIGRMGQVIDTLTASRPDLVILDAVGAQKGLVREYTSRSGLPPLLGISVNQSMGDELRSAYGIHIFLKLLGDDEGLTAKIAEILAPQ